MDLKRQEEMKKDIKIETNQNVTPSGMSTYSFIFVEYNYIRSL